MSYNANVPQAGDFLSVSQIDFQRNFNTIGSIFERNHVSLFDGVVSKRGKHTKIAFNEQAADPATPALSQAIFSKDVAGQPEIYSRLLSNGNVFRWTKSGKIAPSLRLEAYVIFDSQGNILQNPDGEALSYNVTNITIPNALVGGINIYDDWIVHFTTPITTQYYFWNIGAFYGTVTPSPINPLWVATAPWKFGGSYGAAVQTGQLRISTKGPTAIAFPSIQLTQIIQVQIFTVA